MTPCNFSILKPWMSGEYLESTQIFINEHFRKKVKGEIPLLLLVLNTPLCAWSLLPEKLNIKATSNHQHPKLFIKVIEHVEYTSGEQCSPETSITLNWCGVLLFYWQTSLYLITFNFHLRKILYNCNIQTH